MMARSCATPTAAHRLRCPLQTFFAYLTSESHRNCVLRTDYARRMALVEVDVLVAQALGLTVEDLLLIDRVQFPVMQPSVRDTWYDLNGRIAFTNSKGLVGVGLPRKATRGTRDVIVQPPGGPVRRGKLGGDDLHRMRDSGQLPAGSTVSTTGWDDTQPGGRRERIKTWKAPFVLASREEDYRIAWPFFQSQRRLGRAPPSVSLWPGLGERRWFGPGLAEPAVKACANPLEKDLENTNPPPNAYSILGLEIENLLNDQPSAPRLLSSHQPSLCHS